MTGAEIVDGQPHAQAVEFLHDITGAGNIFHHDILGNLQYEQLRGQAGGIEGGRGLG